MNDLGDDHLILRGGGAGKFGWDRLFIFIADSAGEFIYRYIVNRGQNIYFQPQQIFEKAKIKKGGC